MDSGPADLGEPVDRLAFSPGGRHLVAVGRNTVHVLDGLLTSIARLRHDGHPDWVALSTDGRLIATHTPPVVHDSLKRASRTRIWDLATGRELAWRTHEEEDLKQTPGKPLPDSLDLGSLPVGEGGQLALFESVPQWPRLPSGDEAVTPDGRWRAENEKGTAWLLEPETNHKVIPLRLPEDAGVLALAFSPDSLWLATGSGEPPSPLARRTSKASPSGALRLWRLGPVEKLVDEACARLSRRLDSAEWESYVGGTYQTTCP
jgi:WD40 repeat protein